MRTPHPHRRPIHVGDVVRIKHETGHWKVLHTQRAQGGGIRITATSLNAYPRIDITIAASHATRTSQE